MKAGLVWVGGLSCSVVWLVSVDCPAAQWWSLCSTHTGPLGDPGISGVQQADLAAWPPFFSLHGLLAGKDNILTISHLLPKISHLLHTGRVCSLLHKG